MLDAFCLEQGLSPAHLPRFATYIIHSLSYLPSIAGTMLAADEAAARDADVAYMNDAVSLKAYVISNCECSHCFAS
jgi:hypothetical protein